MGVSIEGLRSHAGHTKHIPINGSCAMSTTPACMVLVCSDKRFSPETSGLHGVSDALCKRRPHRSVSPHQPTPIRTHASAGNRAAASKPGRKGGHTRHLSPP